MTETRVPDSWILLTVPVPSLLEQALGYDGEARFVAFYWTPVGDEAMFDDGRSQGDGNWMGFLAYVEHETVSPFLLVPVKPGALGHVYAHIGSSEFEADWWLVIDREKRDAYLAPVAEAQAFVAQQWPPAPDLIPEQVEAVFEALQRAVAQVNAEPLTQEEIEAAVRHQQEIVERLVQRLDEEARKGSSSYWVNLCNE